MLENLNQLALEAKQKSDNYDKKEFIFSSEFKIKFKELLPNYNITFYNYTSVVSTSTNLLIIVPNQWFVIASFFNNYISALKNYKNYVNELRIDKETINIIRNSKVIDIETENKIITKFEDVEIANNFRRFITEYDWWFGSKTIDRTDFHVSPILSLASVINNSQSYIADLANLLSENNELSSLLNSDYNNYEKLNNLENNKTLIEEKKLRNILFFSFKYILKNYSEELILNGSEIKDAKIETRNYKGLIIPKYFGFEILVGIFDKQQKSNELKSSGTLRFIDEEFNIQNNSFSYFTSQWNENNGRGLSLLNFNQLLNDVSLNTLEVIKENGVFKLIQKSNKNSNSPLKNTEQKIFFGSPGTGKSYKVDQIISELDTNFYERVTFHPEFDNNSFVGGYKPVSDKDGGISYKFVPQAFTNIYERAWLDENNQYYLVIEEINRGNCAEIFGDIFQLLDRTSNYTVSPSEELKKHLIEKFKDKNHDGIVNGLKLPPNLTLYATMNTSDQSLFPMDSAFKRRWEWEYVPINYEEFNDNEKPNDSFQYKVFLDDEKVKYFKWIDFIKKVNEVIEANENLGMDKCIGNYFIKSETKEITINEFVNKVIFYLWNDVFKDEQDSVFEKGITFEKFFPINKNAMPLIEKLLSKIDVPILPKAE
jgi:hypothetical protein